MSDLTPAEQVNRRIQNERNEALNRIRVLEEGLNEILSATEQGGSPDAAMVAAMVEEILSTSVGSSDAGVSFCARCNNTGYTAPGEGCMECASDAQVYETGLGQKQGNEI